MTDDDFADMEKDITAEVIAGPAPVETTGGEPGGQASTPAEKTPEKDHPAIALLDIAISESVNYCKKEKLPAPNLSLWENFSRGMLNRSLWHYFPDGDLPDSPAMCMLLGVGGLALCYLPVAMAIYRRETEKKKTEKKADDKKEEKTTAGTEEPQEHEEEETAAPDWMARLEATAGGSLPGM